MARYTFAATSVDEGAEPYVDERADLDEWDDVEAYVHDAVTVGMEGSWEADERQRVTAQAMLHFDPAKGGEAIVRGVRVTVWTPGDG